MLRSYRELISIPSYEERIKYCRTYQQPSTVTFGGYRYLNQQLYTSQDWHRFRRDVIVRDGACDLAHADYPIMYDRILIHHLNPLSPDDLLNKSPVIFDLDNVVCVTHATHNKIHYGKEEPTLLVDRKPNDTSPWLL